MTVQKSLIVISCIFSMLGTGCSVSSTKADIPNHDEAVIIVKNNIDIDDAQSFLLNGGKMAYGVNTVNITEDNMDPYDSGYANDVILVEKEGEYGFYDYEGNVLLSTQFEFIDQNPWVIFASKQDQTYAIKSDFKGYNDNLAGVGGAFPRISIKNGKVASDVEPVSQYDITGTENTIYLVDSEDGTGIIDENYEVLCEMHGWYSCGAAVFANGYVFLSDTEWTYDYETDQDTHGKLMLFDQDGKQILNDTVDDAGYMWDGYAPVKQDDKWAYIDAHGALVTDYLFDEASSLYNGNAYVKYQGQWMIIDVVNTLKNKKIDQEAMDRSLNG